MPPIVWILLEAPRDDGLELGGTFGSSWLARVGVSATMVASRLAELRAANAFWPVGRL